MTGSELYASILASLKRTDKQAEVYAAINNTLRELRLRHDFDETRTTSALLGIATLGDYILTMPDDFAHLAGDIILRQSSDNDSYPLDKLGKAEFDDRYPFPSAPNVFKSKPQHYCIYGGQVMIGQVPDKATYAYVVPYVARLVTEVTSATDPIPFDDYRELLKFGALKRVYADMGNDMEFSKYNALFESMLAQVIESDNSNTSGPAMTEYQGI